MENKHRELVSKLEASETHLKNEVRRLQNLYNNLLIERNEEKNEKSKILDELQKTTTKHEEEI